MSLQAHPALGFDPPERVPITGAADAVAWARREISAFGWFAEVYVLFLSGVGPDGSPGPSLRRAAWLGSATMLDDFVAWPDFSLGYLPAGGADAAMLLVCRPGEGADPTPDDEQVFELLRLAHDARSVPLADVILVDGRSWSSMARH